ncbi:hypothetical protein rerp_29270 [Rhodococcus erythropolis]|nr:hypothetical protein rerp_29270 [Rhodococcus erythropolis]
MCSLGTRGVVSITSVTQVPWDLSAWSGWLGTSARCEWSAQLGQLGRSALSAPSARWAWRSSFHPNLTSYRLIRNLWNFQTIPNSRNYPNFLTIPNFPTIRGCPARFRPADSLPEYYHRADSRLVARLLVDSDSAGLE